MCIRDSSPDMTCRIDDRLDEIAITARHGSLVDTTRINIIKSKDMFARGISGVGAARSASSNFTKYGATFFWVGSYNRGYGIRISAYSPSTNTWIGVFAALLLHCFGSGQLYPYGPVSRADSLLQSSACAQYDSAFIFSTNAGLLSRWYSRTSSRPSCLDLTASSACCRCV